MVAAMVLGGLRRCEVIGLRLSDLRRPSDGCSSPRVRGGHQRLVAISTRFLSHVTLSGDRTSRGRRHRAAVRGPQTTASRAAADRGRVRRGPPGARDRAGLAHATCHELRHTCLTRLREAGMALEAVQAQAGHATIESTRIYLHLADDWLASQYRKAAEAIDAQSSPPTRSAGVSGASHCCCPPGSTSPRVLRS